MSPQPVSGAEGHAIALKPGNTADLRAGQLLNSVTLTFTVPTRGSYTFISTSGLNRTFTAGANQTLALTPAQLAGLSGPNRQTGDGDHQSVSSSWWHSRGEATLRPGHEV